MRWINTIATVAAATLLLAATPSAAQQGWTRAWTASMWQAPAAPVENVTLRSAVRVGVGGKQLRLRLSNEYGPAIKLGGATVRIADGPMVRVTFGGAASAYFPAGAPLVSDAIALPVKVFDVIEVSLYLPEKAGLETAHHAVGQQTQVSPPGDHSAEDFTPVSTMRLRPLIAGIDVLGTRSRPVIVAFGDSITDVVGCANDAKPTCRWSEVLARRLTAAGMPHVVINQATSGNRVISQGFGPSALTRLDRDVLAVPGVSHIVMLEGINDIGNSGFTRDGVKNPEISAAQLIAGYKQILIRAHERGIKVIAMTILPFEGAAYYSVEREAIRVEANNWIRTSGAFDGVIDMEKVVADPANPKRLALAIQGAKGDNLHPTGAGETVMGEAIPLKLFR